jgi:hypothetical protein
MATPDLTDEETEALVRLLRKTIDEDRYPLSPRIRLSPASRLNPTATVAATASRSADGTPKIGCSADQALRHVAVWLPCTLL